MKKRNGFTLVELMVVIIIFITITLITVHLVSKITERSKEKAFIKDANAFVKAALTKSSYARQKSKDPDDMYHNLYYGKVCYSITDRKLDDFVDKSNYKYKGSIEVCYGDDCTYDTKIWFTDGKHYLDGLTYVKDESQITGSFTNEYPESCGVRMVGGGTSGDLNVAEFDYTGGEQKFHVLLDGVYSIEAWGAQGGDYSGQSVGGFGAYSYVDVELKKGDILYVNVGGKGSPRCTGNQDCSGGYNGGAKANSSVGGGGGATHVALKSGTLRNVNIVYVYIVAGGGGGATSNFAELSTHNAGGYFTQMNRLTDCRDYGSGTYGGFSPTETNYNGNGGGYRGNSCRSGSYGGNSYVFNKDTKNGVMYCYDCPSHSHATVCCNNNEEVDPATTKTIEVMKVSEEAVATYSKTGNGFVRITYIGDFPEE